MEVFVNILKCLSFILLFRRHFITGKLSSRESLKTTSECNLGSATTLACGLDAVIALQEVQYGYRSTCSASCCQYSPSDCLVNSTNKQDIIRVCSGQQSCNVPTQQTHDFCSFGIVTASYIYFEYLCIPKTRITDVCSSASLESTDGKPLYLTNVGYPSVTVGTVTCTCSLEAHSCSSVVQNYVIDSDLYQDTSDCQQSLNFTNSEGMKLDAIACESYENSFVTERTLPSNYIMITFISNSTQNREGLFFIGLTASEPNTTISLNCSEQPASWCIDCSTPGSIAYGNITLDVPGNLGYNSSATISCDTDYVANTSKIFCKEQSTWEAAACLPKDCGSPTVLQHGTVVLNDFNNSSRGATATVTCDAGYSATTTQITCQSNGLWEESLCIQDVSLSQSTTSATSTTTVTLTTISPTTTRTTITTTTATLTKPKEDDTSDKAAAIAVPIVVVLVTIVLVCQYVILWKRPQAQDSSKERIISFIPVIGFPVVTYRFCSQTDIFHLKHHPVQENGHVVGKYSSSNLAQYDMIGRTGMKPGTIVTDTGRSVALHDQQQRPDSHVDNDEHGNNQRRRSSVRHDDIQLLEHKLDVPEQNVQNSVPANTESSHLTTQQGGQISNSHAMTRGLSAATNSQTDLPAIGIPRFQHGTSHPSILEGSPVTHHTNNQKDNADLQLTGKDPHARAHERVEHKVPQRRSHAKFTI